MIRWENPRNQSLPGMLSEIRRTPRAHCSKQSSGRRVSQSARRVSQRSIDGASRGAPCSCLGGPLWLCRSVPSVLLTSEIFAGCGECRCAQTVHLAHEVGLGREADRRGAKRRVRVGVLHDPHPQAGEVYDDGGPVWLRPSGCAVRNLALPGHSPDSPGSTGLRLDRTIAQRHS